MSRARRALTAGLGLAALLMVAAGVRAAEPPKDAKDAPAPKPPEETEISYYYDLIDNTAVRPLTRMFDPALWVRTASDNRKEAYNIDENDQVRLPSTWWQPRLGFREVPAEELVSGPGSTEGPAPGKWLVTRAKTQGVTPGFFIKDSRGDRFIIKFDPIIQPEMATGAGVVAAYLFWGAGYNTPNDVIVTFRREDIEPAADAVLTDALGRKKKLSDTYLQDILNRVARNADGSYRALASRLLKGKPLGPFEYRNRRKDDPEDLIVHQHRRELRGLWAMAAWTNHADSRGPNSLDMWVTDGGRSFVRHYLIDFNGCLGSGSYVARSPQTGREYFVDYGIMARSLMTLGLVPAGWEKTVDPQLPSIGFIEASNFDPVDWRPDYPNPAFDERTERDIRWGVRIVAGFTDEHIRTAVAQAKYSDPRASEYLTQVLIQRRDILVRHWLGQSSLASSP